jgi:hypothetical protein
MQNTTLTMGPSSSWISSVALRLISRRRSPLWDLEIFGSPEFFQPIMGRDSLTHKAVFLSENRVQEESFRLVV